jgi:hypothetical protein
MLVTTKYKQAGFHKVIALKCRIKTTNRYRITKGVLVMSFLKELLLGRAQLILCFGGGRRSLYYNYTPCVFSLKIIDPLLRTACTESPPPYCGQIQNIPTPYCRARYPLLQTYKNVYGQLLACGSWRGVQPSQGNGVDPGQLWSREFIAFISKCFRKVHT